MLKLTRKVKLPMTANNIFTVVLDDYDAYCAQHEMDHSQGIMFFDRRRVSRQINRAVEREWKNKKGE